MNERTKNVLLSAVVIVAAFVLYFVLRSRNVPQSTDQAYQPTNYYAGSQPPQMSATGIPTMQPSVAGFMPGNQTVASSGNGSIYSSACCGANNQSASDIVSNFNDVLKSITPGRQSAYVDNAVPAAPVYKISAPVTPVQKVANIITTTYRKMINTTVPGQSNFENEIFSGTADQLALLKMDRNNVAFGSAPMHSTTQAQAQSYMGNPWNNSNVSMGW